MISGKVLSALCVLFFVFCSLTPVSAFTILSDRQTVVIDPKISEVVPVEVVNTEDHPILLVPEWEPFTIENDSGLPVFGGEDEASNWIRAVPEQMLLEPGQSGTFSFSISVPEAVEPKSHYIGLFVQSAPAAGQVGISMRLGSLLFLHVAGDVREELVRKDFSASKLWYTDLPAELHLSLENVGTIHVIPAGTVTFFDGSDKEIARVDVNTDEHKVLPGGTFEETISFRPLLDHPVGPVRAKLDLTYGLAGKELHDVTSFWVVPWTIGALGAGGVLILLFLLMRLGSRKRRKKEPAPAPKKEEKSVASKTKKRKTTTPRKKPKKKKAEEPE